MKLLSLKLNTRGFSHHFVMMLVVLGTAIGGTAYLVASHADTSIAFTNGDLISSNIIGRSDGITTLGYSVPNMTGDKTCNYGAPYDSTWSWSGDDIAFVCGGVDYSTTPAPGRNVLYISSPDGKNPLVVYSSANISTTNGTTITEPNFAWSRAIKDGNPARLLIIESDRAAGYTYDTASHQLTMLKDASGQQVRFDTEGNNTYGFTWNSTNTGIIYTQRLAGAETKIQYCTILLDGSNKICRDLVAVQPIPLDTKGGDVSADGTQYAYLTTDSHINIINVTTGEITHSFPIDPAYQKPLIGNMLWAPDMKSIIIGWTTGSVANTTTAIVMNTVTGAITTFDTNGYQNVSVSWQPRPITSSVACSISNLANPLVYGTAPQPLVNVKNNDVLPATFSVLQNTITTDPTSGKRPILTEVSNLAPGASSAVAFDSTLLYGVGYGNKGDAYTYSAVTTSANNACSAKSALPLMPVSISGSVSNVATYGSIVTIYGSSLPSATVGMFFKQPSVATYTQRRTLTAASNGAFTTTYTATDDNSYYATSTLGKLTNNSAIISTLVRPYVNGATIRTVTKGVSTTVSGKYIPGKTVSIHFHRPTDPAGSYPITHSAVVNSSGVYTNSFIPTVNYTIYVSAPNGTKTGVYTYYVK